MKYDIFAIGNALVDLEFEVSDDELQALEIGKGVMTLIDEHRHHQLIDDLEGVKHAKASGGSAANTLMTAQLLGARTYYCCRVANDETGDFFYEDLRAKGVATNLDENNRAAGVTGKCIVMLTPDAERSMNTFLGISATLSVNDLRESAIQQSTFVYIEGYLVTGDSSQQAALKTLQLARESGAKTVTTLSDPNIVKYFTENLKSILADKVDLLFCNESEASLFCETNDLEIIKQSLQQYAKTFAITLGAHGSLTFDGFNFHHCEAVPTTVIDTLGAGDTFAGAFMYALTQGYSYVEANKLANIAAGKIVSKVGPRINSDDAQLILGKMHDSVIIE